MQHKLSERWSSKEVTSIKRKMVRKLFKVLTNLEIIAYLYRENNKNSNDKLNNKLMNWNQNSNKNNFIDFNLRHEDFSTKTVNTMTNEIK